MEWLTRQWTSVRETFTAARTEWRTKPIDSTYKLFGIPLRLAGIITLVSGLLFGLFFAISKIPSPVWTMLLSLLAYLFMLSLALSRVGLDGKRLPPLEQAMVSTWMLGLLLVTSTAFLMPHAVQPTAPASTQTTLDLKGIATALDGFLRFMVILITFNVSIDRWVIAVRSIRREMRRFARAIIRHERKMGKFRRVRPLTHHL